MSTIRITFTLDVEENDFEGLHSQDFLDILAIDLAETVVATTAVKCVNDITAELLEVKNAD